MFYESLAAARILTAATNLTLAFVVFAARPDRRQNRLIAAVLLGNAFIHTMLGLLPIVSSRHAYALFAPAFLSMLLYVSCYLLFSGTLETPLSRPFRSRWGQRIVVVTALLFALSLFVARDLWYGPVQPWPTDPVAHGWDGLLDAGPLKEALLFLIMLHFIYGFVVAFHAWLRATDPVERRKMKWFAVAFGSHDVLVALAFTMRFGFQAVGVSCAQCDLIAFFYVVSIAGILLATFLAYGILATQLFDIDLRIKRGISRSTIMAIFIAVFVAVATGIEEYVSAEVSIIAGGVAAALLVLVLPLLQRFADKVSDAAMPNVRDTPDYIERRKREIYQAALDSARHDGRVTARERRVLATLADELGLSSVEALELENPGPAGPDGS